MDKWKKLQNKKIDQNKIKEREDSRQRKFLKKKNKIQPNFKILKQMMKEHFTIHYILIKKKSRTRKEIQIIYILQTETNIGKKGIKANGLMHPKSMKMIKKLFFDLHFIKYYNNLP